MSVALGRNDLLQRMAKAVGLPDGVMVRRIVIDCTINEVTTVYVQHFLDERLDRPKTDEVLAEMHAADLCDVVEVTRVDLELGGNIELEAWKAPSP